MINFFEKTIVNIDSCPLCAGHSFDFVQQWDINELMRRWEAERGFIPIPSAYKNHDLIKYECTECGLQSYNYALRDDYPQFYEKLVTEEKKYYHPNRFEYDIIVNDIKKWNRGSKRPMLEIGCGKGFLLEKLNNICNITGTEFNEVCLRHCKDNQLSAIGVSIKDIARDIVFKKNYKPFKALISSQVLEHITNIKEFLDNCYDSISPNGRFYISVPNPEQIAITGNSILNIAPHHQIDFTKKAFDWIAEEYGYEIVFYKKEPLNYRIYRKYKESQECVVIPKDVAIDPKDFARIAKTQFGHTHIVCLQKKVINRHKEKQI